MGVDTIPFFFDKKKERDTIIIVPFFYFLFTKNKRCGSNGPVGAFTNFLVTLLVNYY